MSIKILATADLHIGKTSSGAENQKSASTRNTWGKIIEWALNNNVDAVVIPGDIVDRDNKFVEGMGALMDGLNKLQVNNIHTIITAGNHDFESLPDIMKNFDNEYIHFLGAAGKWETKLITIKNQEIQFVGWSFPRSHYSSNPLEDFPKSEIEIDKTAIGLLHGDYNLNLKESIYAPIDLNSLSQKNIDIWVLGHIHKPGILNDTNPAVLYPGSPQALSAKEQGKHGFQIIEIDNSRARIGDFIPISSVYYKAIKIDITDCENLNDVNTVIFNKLRDYANNIDEYPGLAEIIFDAELVGTYHDLNELRTLNSDSFRESFGIDTKVRKFVFNAQAKIEDLERLSQELTATGMLAKAILDLRNGRSNRLLESVRDKVMQKMDDFEGNTVFMRIREDIRPKKDDINQFLEEELNRLLSEIYNQKVEA